MSLKRYDSPKHVLTLVRALGFDNVRALGFDNQMHVENGRYVSSEKVFFLGADLASGRDEAFHATEDAILNFVEWCNHQSSVAKEYLLNGRENETTKWVERAPSEITTDYDAYIVAKRLRETP